MNVVFSDLDGTLLDHETYSFDAARPALDRLKRDGIPLVLASSKTEAEMRPIAQAIGIAWPMIVENGAGVVGLSGDTEIRQCYGDLRRFLADLPQPLRACFSGFGDWSDTEVAQRTGLPLEAARLARQRQFSEPGLFSGSDAQRQALLERLDAAGFRAAQGGRFFTLMPKTSKADAMATVAAHFRALSNAPVTTIALGDAENDLAMLEAADHGFIIANNAHSPLPVTQRERDGHILRSKAEGPEGWNRTILDHLTRNNS
ncbi:HAD-IIB family hydrolase [Rhizobium halophytocola]|uniref:Mannosyl-3-phosphoglycerate phosphatase n=1 Tax=Rhizobium halophytocola TaxID=735519 RepID=A0ABS4DVL3_9HYPH|nr:HAD-IIB family hydrolase [Rhizobium halophytocola]MBP1849735.1 mannosyl-3-phosphoglycerate phosphatase [Rhizobium halophytocola]